jgi:imipenem/basic amino acid-specific outer membrane pore
VTKMRGRTSTEFVSMTEFAGITTADEPITLAGVTYTGIEGLKLQLWDFYGHEFINNFYFRGDYSREIKEGLLLFGAFQYLEQHDVGDSAGGAVDTRNFTIIAGIKARGAKLSLAVSDNGDDNIFYSWGHDFIVDTPVYRPFRAESTSLQATLSYDFTRMGIQGLGGKVSYTDFNTPDNGTNASPDRDAICFELNYKCRGFFEGLSLKWRLGVYDNDKDFSGDDVRDMRFYIKYSL